ncbi:hypothetical protein CU280_09065 [Yersinia mollaretii]|nr:hypothetical protein CU280_09065 [Yersinia mollaretii]
MMYKVFRADARRLTISLIIINSYQQEEQVFLALLVFFDLYYLFCLDVFLMKLVIIPTLNLILTYIEK